jgi:hypothetical protein
LGLNGLKMKKAFFIIIALVWLQTFCFARDFIVEFVQESYRETQGSYPPRMYHSIQVSSKAGPKLLVLKGNNNVYRKWLRQYIGENKAFIIKIPEDQNDLFISSKAFEIDVTNVHPFNFGLYRQGEKQSKQSSNRYQVKGDPSLSTRDSQESDRKTAEKERLAKEKQQQAEALEVAAQKKAEENKVEGNRLEKEKRLNALMEQRVSEELKRKQEELFTDLAEQRAVEEQQRREEFEQRWLELKKRLLEDEGIRSLDREERAREIQKRWLELKQKF